MILGLAAAAFAMIGTALADQADQDAQNLFNASCGWCHQDGGRAAGTGPVLAGSDKSDAFIVNRIKTGKAPMPAFGGALSEAQIAGLLRYIRALKPDQ